VDYNLFSPDRSKAGRRGGVYMQNLLKAGKGILKFLTFVFEGITTIFAVISALNILLLCVMVSITVVLRYFSGISVGTFTEIFEYLLFLSIIFGAPWVLKNGDHVSVDVLVDLFPQKVKNGVLFFTNLVGTLICAIFFYFGVQAVYESIERGTRLVRVVSIPQYIPILLITIMFALCTYHFFVKIFQRGEKEQIAEKFS